MSIVCASATACAPDNTSPTDVPARKSLAQVVGATPSVGLRIEPYEGGVKTTVLPRRDAQSLLSSTAAPSGSEDAVAAMIAFAKKRPPTLVLTEQLFENGATAEVYLNSGGPTPRLMVIPRATLSDETIDRAYALVKNYELAHRADVRPVKFTLWPTGEFTTSSAAGEQRARQSFEAFYSVQNRRTRWLLESARRVPLQDVPGIGRARVMSLGDPRGR